MKKSVFTGVATAIVTPFNKGKIDFLAYEGLMEHQIQNGISALVVCGTTGEAATLTDEEKKELISLTVKLVKGKIPIVAGCSYNCTEKAAEIALKYGKIGVSALLCTPPYYNKGTADGIVKHFESIAEAGLPVILYNVPSRTGVDLSSEVYDRLYENENIIGVKEASGNVSKSVKLLCEYPDFHVYSGADEVNLPIIASGGDGMISVLSNVAPDMCVKMFDSVQKGDLEKAQSILRILYPLTKKLFCETNPTPIKSALSILGRCRDEVRLPLTALSGEKRIRLEEILRVLSAKSYI